MPYPTESRRVTFLVQISNSSYVVEDARMVYAEALILDAVYSGGAFIDLHDMAGRPVRVLVTPASAVRVEKVPQPVEPRTVTSSIGTSHLRP